MCNVNRPDGFCLSPDKAAIARAEPHYGEEPCISGIKGSGTIFFYGCNMRCVFCQNSIISRGFGGVINKKLYDSNELKNLMYNLGERGVHNINLVTPSHYIDIITETLDKINLNIPIIWNSSGYDNVIQLKKLYKKIQIYMPDLKYSSDEFSIKYSKAPNYTETAQNSILEMYRQCGKYKLDSEGIMQKGLIIRHLVLPGLLENTYGVIDWLYDNLPKNSFLFSLMGQFTPLAETSSKALELNRTLTYNEYYSAVEYMKRRGIINGYIQEPDSAGTDMIPEF